MAQQSRLPEWPRWFRVLCYGLIGLIVLGLTYRTLEDATSAREVLRGVGGIAVFCLWLAYTYLSKTRWRDRNFRTGLALLSCLAITAAVLFVVRPPHERWPDRDLVITFGVGLLFALALVGSRYVSLSSRSFGVLLSAAGVGIAGLGLSGYGSGALGWLETVTTGLFCLVIGLLYAVKPDAMERLERRATRSDSEER